MNSLPKTVTRQRRGCNLNPDPSAPESNTLTTRLPSHPTQRNKISKFVCGVSVVDGAGGGRGVGDATRSQQHAHGPRVGDLSHVPARPSLQ